MQCHFSYRAPDGSTEIFIATTSVLSSAPSYILHWPIVINARMVNFLHAYLLKIFFPENVTYNSCTQSGQPSLDILPFTKKAFPRVLKNRTNGPSTIQQCFWFCSCIHCRIWGILVPRTGIEPMLPTRHGILWKHEFLTTVLLGKSSQFKSLIFPIASEKLKLKLRSHISLYWNSCFFTL